VTARPVAPRRLWVFSVEHDTIQLTWQAMGPGEVTFDAIAVDPRAAAANGGHASVTVHTDGGPGAVLLPDLVAGTRYTIVARGTGAGLPPSGLRRSAATLDPPAGRELFRFATISDLHLGETHFGYLGTMEENPPPEEPHPVRATRAALADLTGWGAQMVVVKGDCTNDSRLDEWALMGTLLDGSGFAPGVPYPSSGAQTSLPPPPDRSVWHALPGNHDKRPIQRERTAREHILWLVRGGLFMRLFAKARPRYGRPVSPLEGFRSVGYEPPQPVRSVAVQGLRIILTDTSTSRFHVGGIRHAESDVFDAVADASRDATPSLVAAHHYPMPLSWPHFWPPGVPAQESEPFFTNLARAATPPGAASPLAFYTAGHTHRHRRYHRSGVVCTEVGSPKDYPGTWAGYIVHEGGITQVVRRVAAPDVLRWTDFSGQAAFGLWKLWSPGIRDHRCFHHRWGSAPHRGNSRPV